MTIHVHNVILKYLYVNCLCLVFWNIVFLEWKNLLFDVQIQKEVLGIDVGLKDGKRVGNDDGNEVGTNDGVSDGVVDGEDEGLFVGVADGKEPDKNNNQSLTTHLSWIINVNLSNITINSLGQRVGHVEGVTDGLCVGIEVGVFVWRLP